MAPEGSDPEKFIGPATSSSRPAWFFNSYFGKTYQNRNLKTDAGKGYAFFGRDYGEVKYFGEGAGIAVRKGEEDLRDAFSAAIDTIRANGEYKAINDKYFEVDIFGG